MSRIINKDECIRLTSLKLSTISQLEREGKFPGRRQLSSNRIGWVLSEVEQWIEKIAAQPPVSSQGKSNHA